MKTDTGAIRPLAPDEQLEDIETVRAELAAGRSDVPAEVAVPPAYLNLPPEVRLALMFGGISRGKDRKASRPRKKSDRQRRYERAQARAARAAKRATR